MAGRYWIGEESKAIACNVIDLSDGGAQIELPRRAHLAPGTVVIVELPIPGGTSRVVTAMRVLAMRFAGRRLAHLCFIDRSAAFRKIVRDAANDWCPAALQPDPVQSDLVYVDLESMLAGWSD